jgi:hypothetical protein
MEQGAEIVFRSGLPGVEFARTGAARDVAAKGFVVDASGEVRVWNAGGVREADDGNILVCGSVPFDGVPAADFALLRLDRNLSISTLRVWAAARAALRSYLGERTAAELPSPCPIGAWVQITSDGGSSVFFAPENFVRMDSGADKKGRIDEVFASEWFSGAARYCHPDL